MSEKPVHSRLRRLVDWINLAGAKKVHSLIDKVYKRKNLEMAWEKVKENRGSGGVDGQSLAAFEAQLGLQLARLRRELEEDTYQPLPVRQHPIPKRDKPGEYRMLGIPAIYDRVCQQALLNRLEPIFEPVFDDASFGYRRGRSTTLPTSRRLGPATYLVASLQALAQCWLETPAYGPALRRVRACSSARFNSFSCLLAALSLRESCLPEIGTGSLGGGRRPARERASSDPRIQIGTCG
jgi:Reverse transcriptase (RNA-dependent DNA polymerase)